jgi:DNA-binding transcriptional ArsR family regulator
MDLEKMHSSASDVSDLLKLLGHPDRLMVLCQLKFGEQSVGELSRNLGIKQSPLSQHLARMRHEGVVTSRRDAQTMYYSIADDKVATASSACSTSSTAREPTRPQACTADPATSTCRMHTWQLPDQLTRISASIGAGTLQHGRN